MGWSQVIHDLKKQAPLVTAELHDYGATPQTLYPSLRMSVYLQRKPKFYIVNIVIPMMIFAALGFLQFEVKPSDVRRPPTHPSWSSNGI